MQSLYFLGLTLAGGILALFLSAGWGSFKHKKIPDKSMLFRSFIAGLVAAGLGAYAWIFGSGGDVEGVISRIGDALDLDAVMKTASVGAALGLVTGGGDTGTSSGTSSSGEDVGRPRVSSGADLTVGMPNF